MLAALDFDTQEIDNVELIIGELVTNALKYTYGQVVIALMHDDEHVAVEVSDAGAGFDVAAGRRQSSFNEGGRGLSIVAAVADKLHIEAGTAGCTVTAELTSSCV